MEYTQELSLELNSNSAYTTVGAKQGDNNTRRIVIHLTQDGAPYTIPNGVDAFFRFRKPDGYAIINKATIQNNSVNVLLTSQTLAAPGRGYADVTLQIGTEILSTVSFIIIIMSAPQVLNQVVSSNEFGYLNDIVASAKDTIYESEAWAVGTRSGVPVNAGAAPIESFSGPNIIGLSVNYNTFFDRVGRNPGLERHFVFNYDVDSWKLTITTINGSNVATEAPVKVTLAQYGVVLETLGSVTDFSNADTFTIITNETDNAYHNNAKYYAEQASASQKSIEDLQITAEKVYADEFGEGEEYAVNDYVWYGNLLYRFITAHQPGPWNSEEVVEEALIDKTVDLQEQVTSLHLHLPQGKTGDVNFMTFEVVTDESDPNCGILMMYKPRGLEQISFQILDSINPVGVPELEGCLGVSINMGGES